MTQLRGKSFLRKLFKVTSSTSQTAEEDWVCGNHFQQCLKKTERAQNSSWHNPSDSGHYHLVHPQFLIITLISLMTKYVDFFSTSKRNIKLVLQHNYCSYLIQPWDSCRATTFFSFYYLSRSIIPYIFFMLGCHKIVAYIQVAL